MATTVSTMPTLPRTRIAATESDSLSSVTKAQAFRELEPIARESFRFQNAESSDTILTT
jgi:hypothetical protein